MSETTKIEAAEETTLEQLLRSGKSEQAESTCCSPREAEGCCAPEDKSACCGEAAATTKKLPRSCGC